MPLRKGSKHALLEEILGPFERVNEETWARVKKALTPISDSYLRSLLKQSGRELAPFVEGVETADVDSAERTLRALASEYETSDPARRKECRRMVIESKDRLRWWLKSPKAVESAEKRAEKEEILLWVFTWLENPALFPEWVTIRRRRITATRTSLP